MQYSDLPVLRGNVTLVDAVTSLRKRSQQIIGVLRSNFFAPDSVKKLDIVFSLKTTVEMVGRSETTIRVAEQDGRLPPPTIGPNGRREGYTLEQINIMRDLFGTRPSRAETDPPVIVAVQNFKGGVGKSTTAVHLAQNLALKGYRVCVIDCDSQASATAMFGFNPDLDVAENETLLDFFGSGEVTLIDYAVRPTCWPGIDLIPANLSLYSAEYEAMARLRGNPTSFDRLGRAVRNLARNYDVVIFDPPPALGMISLSVLRAANALLVPTPPSIVDFASTTHFFSMVEETLQTLKEAGLNDLGYLFVRVIATKVNVSKSAHSEVLSLMESVFERLMLPTVLYDSAEFDNANVLLSSVYEMSGRSSKTHDRCRTNLDALNGEVEKLIRQSWPSVSINPVLAETV